MENLSQSTVESCRNWTEEVSVMPERGGGARIVDYTARQELAELRQKIISHEQLCQALQGETQRSITSLRLDFGTLSGRLDKWMYGVIGLLLASLAYFIVRFGLPGA